MKDNRLLIRVPINLLETKYDNFDITKYRGYYSEGYYAVEQILMATFHDIIKDIEKIKKEQIEKKHTDTYLNNLNKNLHNCKLYLKYPEQFDLSINYEHHNYANPQKMMYNYCYNQDILIKKEYVFCENNSFKNKKDNNHIIKYDFINGLYNKNYQFYKTIQIELANTYKDYNTHEFFTLFKEFLNNHYIFNEQQIVNMNIENFQLKNINHSIYTLELKYNNMIYNKMYEESNFIIEIPINKQYFLYIEKLDELGNHINDFNKSLLEDLRNTENFCVELHDKEDVIDNISIDNINFGTDIITLKKNLLNHINDIENAIKNNKNYIIKIE